MHMDSNFIKFWQMEELSVCDDLITHWKNSEKFPGTNYIPSKGVIINKEELNLFIGVIIYNDLIFFNRILSM